VSSPIRDVLRISIRARQLSDYHIQFQDELFSGIKGLKNGNEERREGEEGGEAERQTQEPRSRGRCMSHKSLLLAVARL
jgi:hypothetical protein